MRYQELLEKIENHYWESSDDCFEFGIRYDDRTLENGYELECSRDNSNRKDERDFPEYGTDEYFSMPELCGTCGYDVEKMSEFDVALNPEKSMMNHCYIIGSKRTTHNDGGDYGEMLFVDAKIIENIF